MYVLSKIIRTLQKSKIVYLSYAITTKANCRTLC